MTLECRVESNTSPRELYKLHDLEDAAKLEFPGAFKLVSDTSKCKFVTREFETEDALDSGTVLQIGWRGQVKFGIPVYAHTRGHDVTYYYGKAGTLHSSGEPFPNEGSSYITGFIEPLSHLAAGVRSERKGKMLPEQKMRVRSQIALAINILFLCNGCIDGIWATASSYIQSEIRELCRSVEENKELENDVQGAISLQDTTATPYAEVAEAQDSDSEDEMPRRNSRIAGTAAKRSVENRARSFSEHSSTRPCKRAAINDQKTKDFLKMAKSLSEDIETERIENRELREQNTQLKADRAEDKNQLRDLRERIRQLEADNAIVEQRATEALDEARAAAERYKVIKKDMQDFLAKH